MPQSRTTIKTSLPYCLFGVDNRFFKLNDGLNTKVRFLKVQTTPNRRTGASKNIETIRDRWGIDAHSDVEIYTDQVFAKLQDAEVFSLQIINDFVKRYQYFDKRAVHLVLLSQEDLFGFNLISDGSGVVSIGLAGGITVFNPLLVHEISNQIETSIIESEKIPFYEELFSNAEQYIYQLSYRHSILESVIALELVISKFILQKCSAKGIEGTDAKNYVKNVGLTGSIKVTLRLLLDDIPLPEDTVFEKCKAELSMWITSCSKRA